MFNPLLDSREFLESPEHPGKVSDLTSLYKTTHRSVARYRRHPHYDDILQEAMVVAVEFSRSSPDGEDLELRLTSKIRRHLQEVRAKMTGCSSRSVQRWKARGKDLPKVGPLDGSEADHHGCEEVDLADVAGSVSHGLAVLRMKANGCSDKEVARDLGVKLKNVKSIITEIKLRFGKN